MYGGSFHYSFLYPCHSRVYDFLMGASALLEAFLVGFGHAHLQK
jgi:hypothetical protein